MAVTILGALAAAPGTILNLLLSYLITHYFLPKGRPISDAATIVSQNACMLAFGLSGFAGRQVMRLRGPLSILGALLFGGAAAIFSGEASADDASLRDAVELTAAAMWYNYKSPGLVLAVVRGDDTVVLGFGETAKGSKL